MLPVQVEVQRLPHAAGLPMPQYATVGSAGFDLSAAIGEPLILAPGDRALVPTGLCLAIPAGYEGQVRGRSGLALRCGLGLPNGVGTIDSDYRGEIKVIVINWSRESQTILPGARIAQLVVAPVAMAELAVVAELSPTPRGDGGFGHTGT